MTLAIAVEDQRRAITAHRERLGVGEYKPITGCIVWHNCTVDYRDNDGRPRKITGVTVHIDRNLVVIWPGGVSSFTRRLGCPGFKIDGK